MNTMKAFRIGLLSLVACGSACSTTSVAYVEDLSGYSVTVGRITKIDGLHSDKVEPLADGLAVTLSEEGCRVRIEFENGETKVFEVGRGVILVHGYDQDYLLTAVLDFPSNDDEASPEDATSQGKRR